MVVLVVLGADTVLVAVLVVLGAEADTVLAAPAEADPDEPELTVLVAPEDADPELPALTAPAEAVPWEAPPDE